MVSKAKNTTELLKLLRAFMVNSKYVPEPIQAYIVPSNDPHNSEYLAETDQLREFITGFTGSAGTAIVTDSQALLWTDGRYYLQASQELDQNWKLMKEGEIQTPTQGQWLIKNLTEGSRIGVDPKVYTTGAWMALKSQLETRDLKLVATPNLVDLVWSQWAKEKPANKPRPARPTNPILPLERKFSGESVAAKVTTIRSKMVEKKAVLLVLTALDEIAWTLNLRGSDIPYNPVFFSYLVITADQIIFFVNKSQVTDDVIKFLTAESEQKVTVQPYEEIEKFLKNEGQKGYVWFSESASYSLTSQVSRKHLLTEITPVALLKAIKNSVEIEGMKNAHIRDAAALCCYFAWLESNVKKIPITEISGATQLEEFRKQQEHFVGLSFPTISGADKNGAIIHYSPSPETDLPITNETLYLCDSGAQFKDGTTDVTRTIHLGTPTAFQKECYTRVLKGQIKLATAVFPLKIKGNYLDSFAREFLWEDGYDYAHGTGHGIGSYLNVHEGPMGISWRPIVDDPGLEPGMFLSNEPGCYMDGHFGIRIEDIVIVVPKNFPPNTTCPSPKKTFLTFETVTLVPKQTKLINVEMLTDKEINYLNDYHKTCREVVGALLQQQGQIEAKEWLNRETKPISKPTKK